MPTKPPSPCTYPGCPEYAADRGRCEQHKHRAGWYRTGDQRGSTERGYGNRWRKKRTAVLARDKYLCQPCLNVGRVTEATEVDHITHKAAGGDDSRDNLQAICHPCHKRKTLRERESG